MDETNMTENQYLTVFHQICHVLLAEECAQVDGFSFYAD